MKPILPREMLWTDKHSMDEFLALDDVNEEVLEAFARLRRQTFGIRADAVKVFNETYYQLTRMMFERPMPSDLPRYVDDIKGNLGGHADAQLVMSMAYLLIALTDKAERRLNKIFVREIYMEFGGCMFWGTFNTTLVKLKAAGRQLAYRFVPQPRGAASLKEVYVNWREITRGYELGCIDSVVRLWRRPEDRRLICQMMKESIDAVAIWKDIDAEQVREFIDHCADTNGGRQPAARLARAAAAAAAATSDQEKKALRERIAMLERENERLASLLTGKKDAAGRNRRFTLGEIVDYCKERVAWDDAKPIVAMLNKMMRNNATPEESKLVDGVEADFLEKYRGNVFLHPAITMTQPCINGPLYGITGNKRVNLGAYEQT